MESFSVVSSFLSMLFTLALILGLLFAAVYFLKRFFPDSTLRFSDNKIINIVSTRYINRKNSILIVEILGKVVVIGASENQLSYLTEISEENALKRIAALKAGGAPPFVSIKKNKLFNKIKLLLGGSFRKEK